MRTRAFDPLRSDFGTVASLALLVVSASSLSADPVASFDINDGSLGPFSQPGWIPVSGIADNADMVSGSDGTYTLTISTTGDGQDRARDAGIFSVDPNLWRDFWFVTEGGGTAVATVSGLEPSTDYSVEIWGYDAFSTPMRSAQWTDSQTGDSAVLGFDGSTTPVPTSLLDSVAVVNSRSDGSGKITLIAGPGAGAGGLPNIFVSGIRVSAGSESELIQFEAESGALGSVFSTSEVGGATAIAVTTTITVLDAPDDPERVGSYSVSFSKPGSYGLYARIYVGPEGFNDDSLFYASDFGLNSPTTAADWISRNGLNEAGYVGDTDIVDGGGSAGNQVWKWIRLDGPFVVPDGALTQTYEIAGREDGLFLDRFVFAPAELNLSVAELEGGVVDQPVGFDGPDGIAIHRFGVESGGRTPDGANPFAGLALVGGALVGTAMSGGATGEGALFSVSLDGETFETLSSLNGVISGAHPRGDFVVTDSGILGVSSGGGSQGAGAVLERATNGTVSLLHSFNDLSEDTASNSGGAVPCGPLASDGGLIFGTATAGGQFSNGTIFSISTSGAEFTVLHDFSELSASFGTNADGSQPLGGLVLSEGRLYGTASEGGTGGSGVVFSLNANGTGFTVLHHFSAPDAVEGVNADGAYPVAGLTVSGDIIYGTTLTGGAEGSGTVFAVGTDGTSFTTIFNFPAIDPLLGINRDGARPAAGLQRLGEVLYGTTSGGGGGGTGTVFALDTAIPDFRTLYEFEPLGDDSTNRFGAFPVAPVRPFGTALYGTAFSGGPGGSGTVFRIPIPVSIEVSGTSHFDGTVDATVTGRGMPYQSYLIEVSGDLENWSDLIIESADANGFIHVFETGLTQPSRFYRLSEP